METKRRITIDTQGHVLLLGLNRPEKRNAFDLQMLRELAEAFTLYHKDAQLRCLVLYAHGDHFSAGLDLAEVGPAVASGGALFPEGLVDPFGLYGERLEKPFLCAVRGFCLTIGVELLLAADIRIAERDARIAQMEVRRGIMPFGGGTLRWPQMTGWGNAMRYLLTGEELLADEALRIGLVQEVVEVGAGLERAQALAERIAAQAPLAVRAILRSARLNLEQGQDAAMGVLLEQTRALMQSEDALEGMMSFIERREARFQGK